MQSVVASFILAKRADGRDPAPSMTIIVAWTRSRIGAPISHSPWTT